MITKKQLSVHPSETFAKCILKSVMQDSSTLSIFTWIIFLSGMFVLLLCIFTDVTLIKMPTDYVCPIMCWTYVKSVMDQESPIAVMIGNCLRPRQKSTWICYRGRNPLDTETEIHLNPTLPRIKILLDPPIAYLLNN